MTFGGPCRTCGRLSLAPFRRDEDAIDPQPGSSSPARRTRLRVHPALTESTMSLVLATALLLFFVNGFLRNADAGPAVLLVVVGILLVIGLRDLVDPHRVHPIKKKNCGRPKKKTLKQT